MTDLNTLLGWSDPIPCGQDRPPHAKPDNVKPNTWVRRDMIVRPEKVMDAQRHPRQAFHPDMIWQVIDGESFLLDCPDALATHTVASYYRIWAGELPEEIEGEVRIDIDALSEEQFLELLLKAHSEEERTNARR